MSQFFRFTQMRLLGTFVLILLLHADSWSGPSCALSLNEVILARLSDAGEITRLNQILHLDVPNFIWDRPKFVKDEIKSKHFYVIRVHKKIVGAISLSQFEGALQIETIAVNPESQGQGLGSTLIAFAVELAKTKNLRQMEVGSYIQYAKRDFYERNGFKLISIEKDSSGYPYYWFSRDLD